jgi:hypothetical protein
MYSNKLIIDDVIPWGKTLQEHRLFFNLKEADLDKNIACFGDGASSVNIELTQMRKRITSFDPIYQFSATELEKRFLHVLKQFTVQIKEVAINEQPIINEVVSCRTKATRLFLKDYEFGKKQERYIPHSLPNKIAFEDNYFDLSLSSHFLLLYDHMGIDFHIQSVTEIMRVSKECRIFPTKNLYGKESTVLHQLIQFLTANQYTVEFVPIDYKFNRQGIEMLKISRSAV